VFRLNFESAANMVTVLRPLISPNNTINANPGNNTLVITDYADNLRRLGRLIDALDASSTTDIDIVPIRYAIASDIAAMVTRLMDAGPADAGRVILMADPRTNSVAVRAPTAARANFARQLIAKLDQPTAQAGNVHVVYLKNAEATKLAATLRAVMSGDTLGAADHADEHAHAGHHRRPVLGRPGQTGSRAARRHRASARAQTPVRRRWASDRRRRRLHPGRRLDQHADHHRQRAGLPQPARRDRPARHAPRAGLHRVDGRRGHRRQGRRIRHPVARPVGQRQQQATASARSIQGPATANNNLGAAGRRQRGTVPGPGIRARRVPPDQRPAHAGRDRQRTAERGRHQHPVDAERSRSTTRRPTSGRPERAFHYRPVHHRGLGRVEQRESVPDRRAQGRRPVSCESSRRFPKAAPSSWRSTRKARTSPMRPAAAGIITNKRAIEPMCWPTTARSSCSAA
jgi:hypothetical protein